jgi:hypothetical protein
MLLLLDIRSQGLTGSGICSPDIGDQSLPDGFGRLAKHVVQPQIITRQRATPNGNH